MPPLNPGPELLRTHGARINSRARLSGPPGPTRETLG